jgi:hypothetical protein
MRISICLAFVCTCVLSAATDFSGVWKANLEKSKLGLREAPTNYLVIIEQQEGKISEKIGLWTDRGEQRSMYTYALTGDKPSRNNDHGLPMRTKISWEGGTLVLDSDVAGRRPVKRHETWSLEGSTLTMNSTNTVNNQKMAMVVVLEKQLDSAGEPLRKPEQTAGEHYKNVKLLKDMPASAFIDAMRSFNEALGKNCEFCHVQGKMDVDDKKEKVTARKMIEMTHNINAQSFDGKMEVRCYSCHKGLAHPQGQPPFVD